MAARVSQTGVLAVDQGTPKARVSQTGVLAVGQGTPKARVSQTGVLAVGQGTPKARTSQMGLLVITSTAVIPITYTFTAEQISSGILSAIQVPVIPVTSGGTGSTLGVQDNHSFGVSGTPVLNDVTQPLFFDRAFTCDGLTIACGGAPSGGSVTLTLQTSTDGVTWSSLTSGAVSATTGNYSGTAACTTAVAANTFLRGKFTAINGAMDVVATLFLRS